MSSPKVWLITGASTGFGRAMTELALSKGDKVAATLRKPEVLDTLKDQYPSNQLLVVKLDVTKPQDIIDAFAATKKAFGRIDVVFNNAGWAVFGETESIAEEQGRAMFDTNFWGAANVMREAIRFFREENAPGVGGRLINNSSVVGISALPISSYYAASKFALEGLTDSVAKELDPAWNIKITLVEPGTTSTNAADVFTTPPVHPAYASNPSLPVIVLRGALQNAIATGSDVKVAVGVLYKVVDLEEPPLHLPLGKDSVDLIRKQVEAIKADVDKYESWSAPL